jgi:hypothetical protein
MLSLQQNSRRSRQNMLCLWGGVEGEGEEAQRMYTHVSKCKNDLKRKNKPKF